ncbi:MAG TPA: M56 family metallopeptidase [Longimicrobium sp.]|jgi:beta-lactamase regulating signal transducer with metallopeptidase domain
MSTALAAGAADPMLGAAALLVLKSTLLLGAAALGARALRRASAAGRHLLWTLALGALLALPALALAGPRWRPGFLAFRAPAVSAPAAPATYVFDRPVRFASNGPVTMPAASPAPAAEPEDGRGFPLAALLLAAWAAGALAVLGRLGVGILRVRRLARGAEPVADYAWTWLAARLGPMVGVRRPVRLLRSPSAAMPMTWGTLRPAVLLPADADGWTPERRRVVLLHELAHVARGDCLTQVLAEVCCALWWFHPGAWWAARRMRLEREQACDDRVLQAGARASDYAAHLLEVARAYAPTPAVALAMARPSHLEGRVRAVLDAERDRAAVTARTGAICAGAVLLAALPLAAVSPSTRAADDEERTPKRVSLTVPVRGQVDASGRVTGRGSANARVDGVDMQFDVNVQMTLDPQARPEVDDAGRLPPFADPRPEPDPHPAFASADEGDGAAPDERAVLEVEGFRMVLRPNAVLEISDESAGASPLRVDLRRYLDPDSRAGVVDQIARFAAAWQVRPAGKDAADADECPEARKARQARELVGKMATAKRGEAGRIVAQLVSELGGGLVDDLADAVSEIESSYDPDGGA